LAIVNLRFYLDCHLSYNYFGENRSKFCSDQEAKMRSQSLYRVIFPLFLLIVLSLACSLSSQPVATGNAPTSEVSEVDVDNVLVDYVYTSELITLISPLYGKHLDDFFIITITNNNDLPVKVVVESEIIGYSDKSIDTVDVAAGEVLEVRQNPRIMPSVIDSLSAERLVQAHIRVMALDDGVERTLLDETAETVLFARRDFPWSISGFTPDEVFELVAAMVMPHDPAVEALIRNAAEYTESGMMWAGYGDHIDDDDGGVWDRLQAIWQAEQDYDLAYINTWVSFAPGSVQRIRLPAEVLDQRSGNCIELAILYASAAEALDLEAAIILVPGHAFVGVRTDQENANYYFIETTMIGDTDFSAAVDSAQRLFTETLPHLEAGESGYGWTNIWDARENGILPLQWK
jgi:hypothetical protein